MPETYRSRRARIAALTKQLRAAGQTWAEIAARIRQEEHVNARVAMRMAHGWTQSEVARLWNERWPAEDGGPGISDKNASYWETWPQSGHEPSLRTLKRLAQLYQCDVGDLIDDGSYSDLDKARRAGQGEGARVVPFDARAPALLALEAPGVTNTALHGDQVFPGDLAPLAFIFGQQPGGKEFGRSLAPLEKLGKLAGNEGVSLPERDAYYKQLVQFLATWADSMRRRELLRLLSWAAAAAVAAPVFPGLSLDDQERVVRVLDGCHRVDEPVIDHIESILWAAMRQDDTLGPQAALDTVLAQRNLVRAVLPECPGQLRPRLLSMFSNLSRFAGWLSFDLRDFDSASYYYEQARTAAHAAENTDLSIFVLCNMSHLATWRGQPRVGIDHAVAAQGWARETDDLLLRAYVADVAARAYAAIGNQRACFEALSSIPDGLGTTAHTPATSLVYFYGRGQYAITRGQCMLQLGDARGAIRAVQESFTLVNRSFVRNHAFGMFHLGNAHIESGEVEEAARVIGDGAELVVHNHSARLAEQLLRSRGRLDRWHRAPGVMALDDRLAAYGWGRSSSV
jgi:transcriptional regulator with XRE-family HTH domain